MAWTTMLLGLVTCLAPGAPRRGEVIFATDFEGAQPLAGWTGSGTLDVGYQSAHGVKVEVTGDQPASAAFQLPLPLERVRGCVLNCSAMVKADNVAKPPQPWSGVKYMLHSAGPGGHRYAQRNDLYGTFDWKRIRFATEIADDATEAWIHLGLEQTTGQAWFDDLRISIAKLPIVRPTRPPAGPIYTGHAVPRLRGTMVAQRIDEAGLKVLGGEWGANLIRWQLGRYFVPGQNPKPEEVESYRAWLDGALTQMESMLPACQANGLMVVVDLHFAPGGDDDGQARLFTDQAYQDELVRTWQTIATRCRGKSVIWAYDLLNEPIEGAVADDALDWHDLAERVGKAIREIDPDTAIVVEPGPGGLPGGFARFTPIDVPQVVYSFHMYQPHTFTHQGVHGRPSGFVYPGEIDGVQWDKERLRATMQPAVDFAKAYGVQMYVGEFSAARWAPDGSAYRYLRDCLDLFEEHGWDWTYHAFRESPIWSVEYDENPDSKQPAAEPTEREKLLRGWFAKSEKP